MTSVRAEPIVAATAIKAQPPKHQQTGSFLLGNRLRLAEDQGHGTSIWHPSPPQSMGHNRPVRGVHGDELADGAVAEADRRLQSLLSVEVTIPAALNVLAEDLRQ